MNWFDNFLYSVMIPMIDISVLQEIKGLKTTAVYFYMNVETLPLP